MATMTSPAPLSLASSPTRAIMKWGGNLLFGLLLLAVLAAAGLYAGLQLSGIRFYHVDSSSMEPSFSTGDVVGVKKVAPHTVKPGDIIAYTNSGFTEPIIHRVVRLQSDPDFRAVYKDENGNSLGEKWTWSPRTYYTKGDNNENEDGFAIAERELLGKQVMIVPAPFNQVVTRFDKQALFAIGIGAIGLFIAWEALDGVRALRRRRAIARHTGDLA